MEFLKDNFNGKVASPLTEFDFSIQNSVISFNFIAHDSTLISYSSKNNDELWRVNVVEIFLDCGDKDYYYEFEVAPNGAWFVAKKYVEHLEMIDNPQFIKILNGISKNTYSVKIEIDLTKIPVKSLVKFNAFRIESGKKLEAFSPTYCSTFHVRERFVLLK